MARGLLIHAGALGDSVLALHVLAALREAGVHERTVLARPTLCTLARLARLADESLDLDSGGFHRLFGPDEIDSNDPLARKLRGFDTVVSMLGRGPDGLGPRRLERLTGGRVCCIDPRPREEFQGHITEQWLVDLRASGLLPPRPEGDSRPRAPARDRLIALPRPRGFPLAASSPGPVALLHPGSGSPQKCWPLPRFLELADRLRAAGHHVAGLLGHVERETWPPEHVRRFFDVAPPPFAGEREPSIEALAALLASADLFVGNDSGVSHLAAALGTPTVAVFGPTDPLRWRPLGPRVAAVRVANGWPDVADVADAAAGVVRRVPQ